MGDIVGAQGLFVCLLVGWERRAGRVMGIRVAVEGK